MQQQYRWFATIALYVDKMEGFTFALCDKLRKLIKPLFSFAPVIIGYPVSDKPFQVSDPHTRVPAACIRQLRPVISFNLFFNAGNTVIRNTDLVISNLLSFHI